jgi:hypothetical protein
MLKVCGFYHNYGNETEMLGLLTVLGIILLYDGRTLTQKYMPKTEVEE